MLSGPRGSGPFHGPRAWMPIRSRRYVRSRLEASEVPALEDRDSREERPPIREQPVARGPYGVHQRIEPRLVRKEAHEITESGSDGDPRSGAREIEGNEPPRRPHDGRGAVRPEAHEPEVPGKRCEALRTGVCELGDVPERCPDDVAPLGKRQSVCSFATPVRRTPW